MGRADSHSARARFRRTARPLPLLDLSEMDVSFMLEWHVQDFVAYRTPEVTSRLADARIHVAFFVSIDLESLRKPMCHTALSELDQIKPQYVDMEL